MGSEAAPRPRAAHREFLRGAGGDVGVRRGRKTRQQRPVGPDSCCEAPAEAELEIPIPSVEIRWSRSNSGG